MGKRSCPVIYFAQGGDCLGLDHERITYRYSGRDFRLTDVRGHIVQKVLA